MTEDSATDLLYTLNHPTVYRLLVVQSGWPGAQYDRWLASTLIEQLLIPAAESGQHQFDATAAAASTMPYPYSGV